MHSFVYTYNGENDELDVSVSFEYNPESYERPDEPGCMAYAYDLTFNVVGYRILDRFGDVVIQFSDDSVRGAAKLMDKHRGLLNAKWTNIYDKNPWLQEDIDALCLRLTSDKEDALQEDLQVSRIGIF